MKMIEVKENEVMQEFRNNNSDFKITMELMHFIAKKFKIYNIYIDDNGIGHADNSSKTKRYWYDISIAKNNIIRVIKEDAYNNREFKNYRVVE